MNRYRAACPDCAESSCHAPTSGEFAAAVTNPAASSISPTITIPHLQGAEVRAFMGYSIAHGGLSVSKGGLSDTRRLSLQVRRRPLAQSCRFPDRQQFKARMALYPGHSRFSKLVRFARLPEPMAQGNQMHAIATPDTRGYACKGRISLDMEVPP